MQIPRIPIAAIVAAYVLISATFLIVLIDEATILSLTAEDAFVENYGGFFFLLAALLFATAFLRSKGFPNQLGSLSTGRNLIYLVLAAMFLFAGGEEISWGQRIFGWATPDSVMEYNRQGEMNIHNLAPFQGGERVINLHFLFSAFWMTFCVLIPLANRIPSSRRWFAVLGVPVTSLWVGGLLIANYVVFKFAAAGFEGDLRHGLNELKESNSAFVWAIVAYLEFRRMSRVTQPRPVAAEPAVADAI